MKYYANYNVNNGAHLQKSLCDTNLKNIVKLVKGYAKGQIFCTPTNTGTYWVKDEHGNDIISGHVLISRNLKPYCRTNKLY